MDTYLAIAEQVLRTSRRPMSALQILKQAYSDGVAPAHLRGRTQHKTLQARLSEDILKWRDDSRFYRTAPGRFLLRELLNDPAIPADGRRPIIARRRTRDLPSHRALAFEQSDVPALLKRSHRCPPSALLDLIAEGAFHYATSSRKRGTSDVVAWSFVLVVRNAAVLTYRQGPFREDRDSFLLRRTIGFYSPIVDTDNNLFETADHGIVSSGLRALASDLGLTHEDVMRTLGEGASLEAFVLPPEPTDDKNLLAIISFRCPEWLEPTSRRLALNDLEWLDLRSLPNHQEDFDPWSRAVLAEARRIAVDGLP